MCDARELIVLLFLIALQIEHLSSSFVQGRYRNVDIVDSFAYFCTCRGLEIYDCTDACNPQMVGNAATDGWATSIDVSGNCAYLADQLNGLCIFNVTDPTDPFLIGHYESEGCTEDVIAQDTLAYLADGNRGLVIMDVSDPSNPYSIGGWAEPGYYSFSVHVADTIAYLGSISVDTITGEPLKIINVADPEHPYLLAEFPQNASPWSNIISAFAVDTLVFMVGSWEWISSHSHFLIANVADPANPQLISNMNLGIPALGVTVSGDYAYACVQDEGVTIIDISNPVTPVTVGHFDEWIDGGYGCSVQDSILVVPHGFEGFSLIDISNPRYPVLLCRKSNLLHTAFEIEPYQRQLYLSSHIMTDYYNHNKLQFTDIGDLIMPIVRSELNLLGQWNIGYEGPGMVTEYPYLAFGLHRTPDDFLGLIDVNDIDHPHLFRFESGTFAGPLALNYPIVYAGYQDNLIIGDASATPLWIDTIALPEYCYGMAIDDSIGYVACRYNLVTINMNTNTLIATYPHGIRNAGCNGGVIVDFPYLYVSFAEFYPGVVYNGFFIFDVSNPGTPSLLSQVSTPEPTPWYWVVSWAKSCFLDDTLFYHCRGTSGFDVYDVSDPAAPILVLTQDTPSSCDDIHVIDDTILVMDELSIEVYTLAGTGIGEISSAKDDTGLSVIEVHPDPFRNNVSISYDFHNPSEKVETTTCYMNIYDVSGRLVKSFDYLTERSGRIIWCGEDENGRQLPQGVYFIRLETDGEHHVRKVILLR